MRSKEDQRAEIRFCVRRGMSPSDTFAQLQRVHGVQCLCKSSVFRWHARFRSGDENLKDKNHNPGPRKLTPELLNKLWTKVNEDKRKTVRQLANEMDISRGATHLALHKKLGFRKAPATWIPHLLTDPEELRRVTWARAALQLLRRHNRPVNIITGDESWFHCWEPGSRQSSSQWIQPGLERRPTKVRIERSGRKLMLVLFFDCYGVVHREFVPDGHGINGETYLEIMKRLWEAVR